MFPSIPPIIRTFVLRLTGGGLILLEISPIVRPARLTGSRLGTLLLFHGFVRFVLLSRFILSDLFTGYVFAVMITGIDQSYRGRTCSDLARHRLHKYFRKSLPLR